jgi:hypothetical protein
MRYLVREVSGWAFILLGLVLFYYCFYLLLDKQICFMLACSVPAFVFFRGGVHLVKVAVAARICDQTQDRLYPVAPASLPPRQAPKPPQPGPLTWEEPRTK